MAIVFPNELETRLLRLMIANETLLLKLYSDDKTPEKTSTATSFTEVSGGGYAAIPMVEADWAIVAGAPSKATGAQKVFAFTGASTTGSAYGYFIVGATSGVLYGAERFDSAVPFPISGAGDEIKITPVLKLS